MSIPIVNLPYLSIQGLNFSAMASSTFTVAAGMARDSTNTYDIPVPNNLTCSTTFVGAGGLDTGTVAPSTAYAVFVIYDPSQNNPSDTLLSLSGTNPLMPSLNGVTYGAFRRIGWIITDPSSVIYPMDQVGTQNDRYYTYRPQLQILATGSAATLTFVPLTGLIGGGVHIVNFNVYFKPTGTTSVMNLYDGNAVVGQTMGQVAGVVVANQILCQTAIASISGVNTQVAAYSIDVGGSVDLYISGYWDFL